MALKLFPNRCVTYKTYLDKNQIKAKIFSLIDSTNRNFLIVTNQSYKPFEGEITDDGFIINKPITRRNSFTPLIKAKITSNNQDSIVFVEMDVHPLVISFVTVFYTIAGLGCIGSIIITIILGRIMPILLIPFGLLTGSYLLTTLCFLFESQELKIELKRILKSEIIK
ncbi:MAG: hypothetical protein U0V72_11575 [Cytophagales bacterium]